MPRLEDRFDVVEKIGSGRTSTVHRAIDKETGKEVAVKSIRAEYLLGNPDGAMRFLREGATLKRLDHPYIVHVYDTIDETYGSFMVMEYLSGGTLEYKITVEGQLRVDFTLSTMLKIADALAYLHGNKVIHRDITPLNIMLNERGEPRLMDFSSAKWGHLSPMTLKGSLLGSISYMSPEVLLGQTAATVASDIWGFGMTMYKMLAGQLPFVIESNRDVLTLTQTPVPPISRFRDDVPIDVAALLIKMLKIAPEERIGSAEAVRDQLREILQANPSD